MSESGTDLIWETRMQKWMKCRVPPMRKADVLGAGSGTLFGKMDISKAIRDGKAVALNPSKSQLDNVTREGVESPLIQTLLAHGTLAWCTLHARAVEFAITSTATFRT